MTAKADALFSAGNMPAFPCEAQGNRSVPPEHDYLQTGIYSAKFPGMTLRDWFAGQAITICLKDMTLGPEAWAREAYAIADAILTARAGGKPHDGQG